MDLRGVLTWVCNATGGLLIVAAGLLYAIGNVTDSSGAKGQSAMIACALGSAVAFAMGVVVGNVDLTYGG